MKPRANERDYFARQEADRSRKVADALEAKLLEEERERQRSLHLIKCPECGMRLEEIAVGDVRVDKCSSCEGIWLDKGELEVSRKGERGVVERLLSVLR